MKLWGKIRATKKDYFIAEGVLEKAEGEEGADASADIAEPRGAPGINKMVYCYNNRNEVKEKGFIASKDASLFTEEIFINNIVNILNLYI